MLKAAKVIGGWLLAIWGAVRAVVDLLGSIDATKQYAEFLYCHWYLAFPLIPKSALLTAGVILMGSGLIFSDRLIAITDTWWPRTPNIALHRVLNAGVTWDGSNGCYIRQPNLDTPRIAIILEIANEVEAGKASPTAGRVKAQITYHYADSSRPDLRVVPCAWVDEPLNSVELGCGDTRWLIAALSFHFTQDWRVPVNRRSDIVNPQSFDHHEIYGWSDSHGTMEVNLISMETNKILTTFSFDWQWTTGYSLTLTRYKGIRDS